MCGIFGWKTLYQNKRIRRKTAVLASILAYSNDKRGGDSWGIYSFGGMTKGLGNLCEADPYTIDMLSNSGAVLGHTRKATTGDVIPENSHPFHIKNVIGAHNGVVNNHTDLNKTHSRTCVVDSQHIFHHIAEDKPLTEISAYGAIEYVLEDDPNAGVFLGKFNGGDLAIAQTEIGPVWNSNKADLISALRVSGIKFRTYKVQDNVLYKLVENKAYQEKELKFAPYVKVTPSNTYQSWSDYDEYWDHTSRKWVKKTGSAKTASNAGGHWNESIWNWD